MNKETLIGKRLEIRFHKNIQGEYASLVPHPEIEGSHLFKFERYEDDIDDSYVWANQEPEAIVDGMALFTTIGETHFYVKEASNDESNVITTIKELCDSLNLDVVYVNGYIKILEILGKAKIVGKVKQPDGKRGKPANLYEIERSAFGLKTKI